MGVVNCADLQGVRHDRAVLPADLRGVGVLSVQRHGVADR